MSNVSNKNLGLLFFNFSFSFPRCSSSSPEICKDFHNSRNLEAISKQLTDMSLSHNNSRNLDPSPQPSSLPAQPTPPSNRTCVQGWVILEKACQLAASLFAFLRSFFFYFDCFESNSVESEPSSKASINLAVRPHLNNAKARRLRNLDVAASDPLRVF